MPFTFSFTGFADVECYVENFSNELPPSKSFGDTLYSQEGLSNFIRIGDYLESKNGRFFAILQEDGNFCVYEGSASTGRTEEGFKWGSMNAAGYEVDGGTEWRVEMRRDGNFVVENGSEFKFGSAQDAQYSVVIDAEQNYRLVMQDDGDLQVLREDGSVRYSTKTTHGYDAAKTTVSTLQVGEALKVGQYLESVNGLFFCVLQSDGNFVVYKRPQEFRYGSALRGFYGAEQGDWIATLQEDGNFVIYKSTMTAITEPRSLDGVWQENTVRIRGTDFTHTWLGKTNYYTLSDITEDSFKIHGDGAGPEGFGHGSATYTTDTINWANGATFTRETAAPVTKMQMEWKFGTVQDGKYEPTPGSYTAVMQDDGDFVILAEGGTVVYSTSKQAGYDLE